MSNLQLKVILAAVDKLTAPLKTGQRTAKGLGATMAATKKSIADMEKQAKQIDGYRKLTGQTAATSAKLKEAQDKVKQLAQEMATAQAPTKEQTKALKDAQAAAAALKRQHAELAERQQRARTALNEAGLATKNLSTHQRTLNTNLAAANQQLTQQRQRLEQVTAQERRLANARASAQQARAFQGQLAGAGARGMALGGSALFAGGRFASYGIDFGAEMSRVQALTRLQKDDPMMKALHSQARELGAKTSFSAQDAASGQGFLAMAGFTPQAIHDAMPGMLDLAKAAGLDIAETADIGSNILTGFKLPAAEMARVGDVLVGAFTRSNVDMNMLGDTMKYVAPVAAGLGVTLEQAAAMTGKLGDAGIQGSKGGTALRAILGRMAAPPKAAAKALAELGIKTADSKGNFRDISEILTEIDAKTRKMGSATRAGYFKTIAGDEAFAALEVLASQAGSGELQKLMQEIAENHGEAKAVAKTMADNIQGDISELESSWEELGIQLTETSEGPLRKMIRRAAEMIDKVTAWTKANPELTATITKWAAIMAGAAFVGGALALTIAGLLGPLIAFKLAASVLGIRTLPILGVAIRGIGRGLVWLAMRAVPLLIKGLLSMSVALVTTPIGWVILAITAIAAGAYLIYKNWGPIKAFMSELWGSIKSSVGEFWDATTEWFTSLPGRAMDAGSRMMKNFVQGIRDMLPSIDGVMDALRSVVPDWIMGDDPVLVGAGAPLRTDYAPLMARASSGNRTTSINAPITIVQQQGENNRDLASRLQGELQQVVAGKPARPWAVLGDLD